MSRSRFQGTEVTIVTGAFQLLWNNVKHKHKQTSHALLYLLSRESLGASGADKNTRRETRDFYFYTVYVWQYNTRNCYKINFNAKNGRVCVFSDASGEDERGARTAFVTWASWRVTSRTANASWLATLTRVWTESESFRDSESFESNDSFTRKMIQHHRNIRLGGTCWSKRCTCNKNSALIYYM